MPKNPTKAFVLPVAGRDAEIQSLIELIKSAGCETVCDQKGHKDIEKCIAVADVLAVLICPETMNDPQVDKAIEVAIRAGKRVVGVWAPNSKEDAALPAAINKYGDATIPFDEKFVKDTICGGNTDWFTPSGHPRVAPKTPRHKGK